ncbi:MAG: 4Fe-4S dicluster domain-containing protein [Rhodobacteraceae bacterium]|nr:4Fe-4S dicluster domain-containing protein [Paracoccaceae bacterium]
MTCLPSSTDKKLGLVIDLDTCVGCHACVVSCKGWNTENYGAPLADQDAYGENPLGTFLNRVHSYEVQPEDSPAQLIHFPKSCLHCDDAPCVTVCPTGARELDGEEKVMKKCTLCVDRIYNENLPEEDRVPACVRTCPTGARHFGDLGDPDSGVSKLVADRGGFDLMPEMNTKPVNKYLPPRLKDRLDPERNETHALEAQAENPQGFFAWLDRTLEKL